MIIQLTGRVTYPITLDPTVWIFDDRKILFEDAFNDKQTKEDTSDELRKTSERFEREYFIKPPVNRSINKFERNKILENTYVMPIEDFVNTSEISETANQVRIEGNNTNSFISIEQLKSCYLLFAKDGKPLKQDGPAHLYFNDGSNKDNPIKNVEKIIIE